MIFPKPDTGKDELEKLGELPNSLFAARANVSAKISRYEDVLTATSRSGRIRTADKGKDCWEEKQKAVI